MDRKTAKVSKKRRTGRKGGGKMSLTDRRLNSVYLRWSYPFTLTSGTSGTISNSTSPTIQNMTELSYVQGLYTSVRLIRCIITYSPIATNSTSVNQGRLIVGTNMAMNGTTNTPPTANSSVENLRNVKFIFTGEKKIHTYDMYVPRGLLFLPTTSGADVPTLPEPFAGSPGVVQHWSDTLTASTNYFEVNVTCIHQFANRN